MRLKIFAVNLDYILFLKTIEPRVSIPKDAISILQSGRPFVGVVFECNDIYYFAPWSKEYWKWNPITNQKELRNNPTDINLFERKPHTVDNCMAVVKMNNCIPMSKNTITMLADDNIQNWIFNQVSSAELKDYLKLIHNENIALNDPDVKNEVIAKAQKYILGCNNFLNVNGKKIFDNRLICVDNDFLVKYVVEPNIYFIKDPIKRQYEHQNAINLLKNTHPNVIAHLNKIKNKKKKQNNNLKLTPNKLNSHGRS